MIALGFGADAPIDHPMRSSKTITVLVYAIVVLTLVYVCLILGLKMNRAIPVGGVDEGKLYLAGATSFLQGKGYPITQRAPFYSLFLAGLGRLSGVNPFDTIPAAHEWGSIEMREVAKDFLKPRFQHVALIVQFVIWLATAFIVYRALLHLKVSHESAGIFLLFFLGASWVLVIYIYDPVLTQFLLAIGLYGFVLWLKDPERSHWLWASGAAFALAALSRATFQLLSLCLIAACYFLLKSGLMSLKNRSIPWGKTATRFLFVYLACWVVLVGGFSVRNYLQHGFFGVSCPASLSLAGRATPFLEKVQAEYPEEIAEFVKLRDIRGTGWSARGMMWLMTNRGMTWPQANNFMIKISSLVFIRAPMHFFVEFIKGLVTFHMPNALKGERVFLLSLYAVDFVLISVFLVATMMWVSFHLLRIISPAVSARWTAYDSLILFCEIIYWYCAVISSAMDYGRPEHRTSVIFIMPFTLVLIAARFQILQGKFMAHWRFGG